MKSITKEENTHSIRIMFKKFFLYTVGLFIMSVGVNFSKACGLGISPVSAIPYVVELITEIDLAITSAVFMMLLIALQILILRSKFKPFQLLQFALTYLLSFFLLISSPSYLLFWLPTSQNYITSLIYLLISIILIGMGVSFYLLPKWIPNPGEGLVSAITEISNGKFKFHNVKIAIDVAFVTCSAILSFIYFGKLISVREGTVLAALLVGKVVGFSHRHFRDALITWMNE